MSFNNEFTFYVCRKCYQALFINELVLSIDSETNSLFYDNSNQIIPSLNRLISCNECFEIIGLELNQYTIKFNLNKITKVKIQATNN